MKMHSVSISVPGAGVHRPTPPPPKFQVKNLIRQTSWHISPESKSDELKFKTVITLYDSSNGNSDTPYRPFQKLFPTSNKTEGPVSAPKHSIIPCPDSNCPKYSCRPNDIVTKFPPHASDISHRQISRESSAYNSLSSGSGSNSSLSSLQRSGRSSGSDSCLGSSPSSSCSEGEEIESGKAKGKGYRPFKGYPWQKPSITAFKGRRVASAYHSRLSYIQPSTLKEYDLEQRIALEIKMREGTTKLLTACGGRGGSGSQAAGQPHILEASKSLLTSNERMTAYMAELQRRRAASRRNHGAANNCDDSSQARVCLSDLRMPLLWKDIDHFKNKGDPRKFAVFVLLKIGTEIYDTVMVNPVDRSMTDICFDDIIVFNGVTPTFECSLEVYSYLFENELTVGSIPRKIKKTIHSSISRTVGRKLAATLRDELNNGDVGPKFDLVASAKLSLNHISNNISTYDLVLENNENKPNQLPLFGHFCCRLAAQPDCFTQERRSGFAKVHESEFSPEPSWCRLLGWRLELWQSQEEAEISPHHPQALSIDSTTDVSQAPCNTLVISNTQGLDRGRFTLTFSTADECMKWLSVLRQHIFDHGRWGKAAEEEMEILTPQTTRHSFILPKKGKFTSLYEETPLKDGSSPSSEKSSYDDLYNSTSFINSYCTPAMPAPRTRALTLSSRASFRRWGSVRANMPFFKTKG